MPFALVGIADLLAKRAVLASFVPDERHTLVPHLLDLTYVENTHGAMGLFGDAVAPLVLLAVAALAALWSLLWPTLRRSPLAQVGFGTVAGGAVGNVVDRITHGYVVDFIALPHFYVFNLADAAISVGLVLIAAATLRPVRTA